jgi:hypothetical protein
MLWGSEYFQIIHGKMRTVGELTPTGTFPLQKNLAMKRSADEFAEVASGDMLGFLGQQVTAAGPTYEQLNFRVDLVAKAGHKVSIKVLEDGGEFEVEGEPSKGPTDSQNGLLITSGTGAVTNSTAVGTQLSVYQGRWRVAQTGDFVLAIVRDNTITPLADASNIRILAEFRRSGIKVS